MTVGDAITNVLGFTSLMGKRLWKEKKKKIL